MAARNPTDFTRHLQERMFVPGRPILESEIDKAYNDQVYVLDAAQMVLSDCWHRTLITSTAAFSTAGSVAAQLVRQWYFDAKDMCDVAGVVTNDGIGCELRVRAWKDGAGVTQAQIRATTGASANNQNTLTNALTTSPAWYTIADTNVRTNDTEESLILEGRVSGGAGTIYIDAFGVFAKET